MLILDSSLLIAYHNRNDVHHAAASQIMGDLVNGEYEGALLLEYVFLEVVTVLLARRGLAAATSVADKLLAAREVEFVPCSDLFNDALETFRAQKRTTLSFTDAALVAVARQRKGSSIATFDKDFRRIEGIHLIP